MDTPATMNALVLGSDGALEFQTRPVPSPGPGELLVQVVMCGVCGTDFAEVQDGPRLTRERIEKAGSITLGHEFVGRVHGADPANGFSVGDLVTSGSGIPCGHCPRCDEGRPNLCVSYHSVGLQRDGGLAEFVTVPAEVCVKVPEGLPPELAVLAQPAGIAEHAVERSGAAAGETALVVGCGGVGLFVVAALVRRNVAVRVVDRDPARAAAALRVAGEAAASDDIEADVAFEVTGHESGLVSALAGVRPGGRIALIGLPEKPLPVDLTTLVLQEKDLIPSSAQVPVRDISAALTTIAARPEAWDGVAPTVYTLAEARDFLSGRMARENAKIIVDPAATKSRPAQPAMATHAERDAR